MPSRRRATEFCRRRRATRVGGNCQPTGTIAGYRYHHRHRSGYRPRAVFQHGPAAGDIIQYELPAAVAVGAR